MKIYYNVTYAIVTPESAEDGDFAETGFIEEDSWASSIKDFIELLKSEGYINPSSSDPQGTRWWSTEPCMDQDGSEETRSIHPDWAKMTPHQTQRVRHIISTRLKGE